MERKTPVNKNDIIELQIEAQGSEGEGIGRLEGFTIFVEEGLIGEKLEVKIVKVTKNCAHAKLLRILEPSQVRCEPKCKIAKQCGGCQLQHMQYEDQLEFKRNKVEQAIKRIGGIDIAVKPTMGMENPYFYRNKGQFPVGDDYSGISEAPVIGFYAKRSHRIIPFELCWIQNESHVEIITVVKKYMAENGATPYVEESHKGLVRHIVTRQSHASGEINLTLVINGNTIPNQNKLIEGLRTIPSITSICLNINKERTNVIFGEKTFAIFGDIYITDQIGEIQFRISPQSFYQVNPLQTEKLYQKALQFAGLTGNEIVWDAYCGIGTISLFLAQQARKVYGVEIVKEAIEDAKFNMRMNRIENVDFFVGKAEEVIESEYKNGVIADVIVVDPPRKGCDEALLKTMIKMQPKRIVYVSCDPGTLARDLKVLASGGYEVVEVQPVDMFPMTTHVEVVCVLTK